MAVTRSRKVVKQATRRHRQTGSGPNENDAKRNFNRIRYTEIGPWGGGQEARLRAIFADMPDKIPFEAIIARFIADGRAGLNSLTPEIAAGTLTAATARERAERGLVPLVQRAEAEIRQEISRQQAAAERRRVAEEELIAAIRTAEAQSVERLRAMFVYGPRRFEEIIVQHNADIERLIGQVVDALRTTTVPIGLIKERIEKIGVEAFNRARDAIQQEKARLEAQDANQKRRDAEEELSAGIQATREKSVKQLREMFVHGPRRFEEIIVEYNADLQGLDVRIVNSLRTTDVPIGIIKELIQRKEVEAFNKARDAIQQENARLEAQDANQRRRAAEAAAHLQLPGPRMFQVPEEVLRVVGVQPDLPLLRDPQPPRPAGYNHVPGPRRFGVPGQVPRVEVVQLPLFRDPQPPRPAVYNPVAPHGRINVP